MKQKQGQDDAALLRQALVGVTPLKPQGRVPPPPPRRKPPPRAAASAPLPDTLSDHDRGGEPPGEFLRPGMARTVLRQLKRGQPPAQDRLDLHGLSSDGARKLLQEFLREATQRALRRVLVIHGKGWRAEGGEGVLKTRTRHWLTQCPEVLAFCEASPGEGGGGAVKVLLRLRDTTIG